MRSLGIICALWAGAAAAQAVEPPSAFVEFVSATRAAETLIARCDQVIGDRQGFVWANERMWRQMDAEGISRMDFRGDVRPLTQAQKDSVWNAFLVSHDLTPSDPTTSFCAAARVEAGGDSVLGSLLTVTDGTE